MSRPARLGLAALIVLLLAGGGIYGVIKTRGTGGYRMGVHFRGAAGVAPGALVYFNGVNIGNVQKVKILPDTTVDMILNVFHDTDIPRSAQFMIQSSFTGSPTIQIVLPRRVAQNEVFTPIPQSALLPKRVVPVEEQPRGTEPLSIEDVMGESKALGDRAQRALALAKPYGPRLLGNVRNTQANAAASAQEMRGAFPAILGTLQSTIAKAKANAQDAQRALRGRDRPELAGIAAAFQQSAKDMSSVSGSLASIKNDPQVHANVRAAAVELRAATANMAGLSRDMEFASKNAQTKAELHDAGLRFRSIMERLKSLLP